MRSSHSLDRLDTAFDDDRLLRELVEAHLDLGAAPGRANVWDKVS